jgi:hypothetical protein
MGFPRVKRLRKTAVDEVEKTFPQKGVCINLRIAVRLSRRSNP